MARSDAAGPKGSAQLTVAPLKRNGSIKISSAAPTPGEKHWAALASLVVECSSAYVDGRVSEQPAA